MKLSGNTILITGGASGIGLALAERFVAAGSQVLVCGRREAQLREAERRVPGLKGFRCDVGSESDRRDLIGRLAREYPELNVLVNNAGIQNRPPTLLEAQDWDRHRQEIAINLEAPMHLSMLLIPFLLKARDPAIVNVSSGLSFAPLAAMPTYCATKAALHSYTLSLRHQLRATPIQVVEVIPPAVNTDLGGKGLHTFGVLLADFTAHTMAKLAQGELEFGYESSEMRRLASRQQLDEYFAQMNRG